MKRNALNSSVGITHGNGLRRFQDAFSQALFAAGTSPEIEQLVAQPGFAVYRNTVIKGCIDALQANYPAVARLVGDEWFRAAAAIFARAHPPRRPTLIDYGDGFAAFLAAFEPAQDLPYLAGVALVERFWTEAHVARDEAPVDASVIAALNPAQLAQTALRPHAAARWMWFATQPILTIWQRNRVDDAAQVGFDWRPEGALLTRPHGAVQAVEIDAAGCAFMDACANGNTLADAALTALEVDRNVDLARLMATLLEAGALSGFEIKGKAPEEAIQ